MRYILIFLTGLAAGIILGLVFFAKPVGATIQPEDWSCQSNGAQCGTNNGTEYVCPKGYERSGNSCKKWVDTTYKCNFTVNTHGFNRDYSWFYDKPTGDSHHCHRITWNSLSETVQGYFKLWHYSNHDFGNPNHGSWTSAYNSHVDENPHANIDVAGHWDYTDKVSQACIAGEPRYDGCKYHSICREFSCVQVEGEGESTCETDKDCEPEITPTPTPEVPAPQPCNGCGQVPSAYMCPNGQVKQLPQALFVFRKGSEATITWFRTGGDQVNILYKELGQPGWTHALRDQANKAWNSYTIRDLNPRLGYVFGIMQKDGCGGGEIAVAEVLDGAETQVFPMTGWSWFK